MFLLPRLLKCLDTQIVPYVASLPSPSTLVALELVRQHI
jgi:hypothetical protein